ncbi:MAG: cytochrome c3 family protein [Planctomycetota bacterium]
MLNKVSVLMLLMISVCVPNLMAVEKPTALEGSCVTADCHTDFSKNEHVHAPVELGDCKSCHESADVEEHTFNLLRKGRDLCESCHLDQATKSNVHKPLTTGDCTQCHDPHAGNTKSLLLTESVDKLCANCHNIAEQANYLHGPVAVGECSICHEPHSSDHENLMSMPPKELCASCHTITMDELEKFEFIHEPAKGDCAGCHDPHGADNPNMLKGTPPEVCYACHEDIKKIAENAAFKHSVVAKGESCLRCHTPHASTVKYLMKNDPYDLCMSCHDKPVGIDKENVLPSFLDQVDNKKYPHGPVAEKDCSGCHTAHGSEHFRLLAKTYPDLFYAPYAEENYELCFSCHSKELALTEKTDKLTEFRNGKLNLHFLHVNKDRRGRTCRACHQTHASDLPKHIRESVPYGRWELPVKFTKTETGGSCTPGCHKVKDYDRKTPVDYTAAVPAKKPEPVPQPEPETKPEPVNDQQEPTDAEPAQQEVTESA